MKGQGKRAKKALDFQHASKHALWGNFRECVARMVFKVICCLQFYLVHVTRSPVEGCSK